MSFRFIRLLSCRHLLMRMYAPLLLFVCSIWQPAYGDWLRETSGFRGGFLINVGNLSLNGESNPIFDGVNGLKLSGSYMRALDKDIYESQIIYFEYGFGYAAFNGEELENQDCILNGRLQNCSITNSIQILDLNASALFFWHINSYSALFGRLGIGYSLTTIDQVANGESGTDNQSSDSIALASLITGAGILIAKTAKIEILQYTVGGNVQGARNRVAEVEGTYAVTEIRLSILL